MIINFSLDTVEQERFTYEIVIPRSLRSSKSFSDLPDWKARLRDKDQPTYLSSAIHRKNLLNNPNTTIYYRINAFNQIFDLSLIEDEAFLAPSFVFQHYDHNRTWSTTDIEHCFYKGSVNQNSLSTVSISLCHGLVCKNFFLSMRKTCVRQDIVIKKKSININWLELT